MIEILTNPLHVYSAKQRIAELLEGHAEWFYMTSVGGSQALRRSEFDVSVSHGRLILSCWTEQGIRSWRVTAWEWTGEKLSFQGWRRLGAERPLIEFIPRASARAIAATVKAARQARCERMARAASLVIPEAKIEQARLSPGIRRGQPGTYARILLRLKYQRIGVTGSVVASTTGDIDAILASALLWFTRTSERVRPPYVQQLWLITEPALVRPALERIALLRDSLREVISVYQVDAESSELLPVQRLERGDLWKRRTSRFPPIGEAIMSPWICRTIAGAPGAIDVVHAKHGETLRYFGLPFARVRQLMDAERVWFGVEGSPRMMLDAKTEESWINLLADLALHRSPDALDHRHVLYRNAAEAWLESLLRRDITQLDPGLIVAPLYAQFRTARGGRIGVRPIDLLALRRDGRLVVIELKVSESREHVLQGADYWYRVEIHRRRGHIARAKLFGDWPINDEPPLVYLVAPTLRVHPSFRTLARMIAPDIEMYRFDINEDWRAGVRVMRRIRVN